MRNTIRQISLIRPVYRALINSGRSYAAFTEKEERLVEQLCDRSVILDPMSGYGGITRLCSASGVQSYCVELNRPQYLWQVLCDPGNTEAFAQSIDNLLWWRAKWPKVDTRADVSDDFFTPTSLALLSTLLDLSLAATGAAFAGGGDEAEKCLALLLPFAGRLSCSSSRIATHTKRGGMCVYIGWDEDFEGYLRAMRERLSVVAASARERRHVIAWGDARTHPFPSGQFGAMVTSPPYPNRTDFGSMFLPELDFLNWADQSHGVPCGKCGEPLIGSVVVTGRKGNHPRTTAAQRFLHDVASLKLKPRAQRDDETYFLPYYANYFVALEEAYANISQAAASRFEGYITVRNNTHRSVTVPVCEVVMGIWRQLGFSTKIVGEEELFHVGTMNPRARGVKARQREFVIRVWRG